MGRLDGRVAFLTGAGRGIGAATAAKLAAEGAAVAVTDMDIGPAEETAEAVRSAGGRALGLPRGRGQCDRLSRQRRGQLCQRPDHLRGRRPAGIGTLKTTVR